MFFYSKISCRVIGKVLYNSTFKGRENGPVLYSYFVKTQWHENKNESSENISPDCALKMSIIN